MTKLNTFTKLKRVLAFSIAAILSFSMPVQVLADTAVKTSNYVISKPDEARLQLEKLANARSIDAVIYLKDAYTLKSEADAYSEDVITLATGQSVSVISVGIDEGRNIWYKVRYSYAGGTLEGFVEREFLASGDTRFLEWEDKYITTKNREAIRELGDCSDIEQFPENYRDALYELKKAHPNWIFVKQNIGIDWKTVLYNESIGERSLISSSADSSYKGAPSAGTAGWYNATEGIIAYYLDPRNFLVEDRIFMFEMETYNENIHTESSVGKVLSGTFLDCTNPENGKTYAGILVEAGKKYNMSPVALASRLKQEQGKGTSPLISGKYPGYEGYYNYFNVKANGATKELIYINGLNYAKKQGWNSRTASITGGSEIVASQYVNRGQDTLYLQKFDVDGSDNTLYTHQYMQNISAPYSESYTTYKAYSNAGLLDSAYVFKIPVYNNMPKGKCMKPNAKDVISLDSTEVENLPVDQNAVLVSFINGAQNLDVPMTYESSDKNVVTVDENGVLTGIRPGNATITAKRTENSTNTVTCNVSVIKADIALSKVEIPQIETTYNPDGTLADIELPKEFAWTDTKIIPMVDNEGYSVIYNPDNSRYNALTLSVPVKVNKAEVDEKDIVMPTGLSMEAGAELSTVALPEGFAWVDSSVTAPNKTGTRSYEAYYCPNPALYEQSPVKLNVKVVCTEHVFGEWEGEHADCEHEGHLQRKCERCGYTEKLDEVAKGHKYNGEVTTEPTEDAEGVRTYTCSLCGDVYTESIPKLEKTHKHKYEEIVTKEASCLENGVMTYTCECGDSYSEPIEALGHEYDDKNKCKRCGYELPVVPIHIHDYSLSGCTATCTEDGENIYTCGCGASYSEPADKLGHDIKNGKCARCDYSSEPTPTAAATPETTPTATAKPTVAATPETTPTATAKPTAAATPETTPTVTTKPASTSTLTAKATPTAEPTAKATPTAEPTATTAPTSAPTPTSEPTVAPTPTATPVPTEKPDGASLDASPVAKTQDDGLMKGAEGTRVEPVIEKPISIVMMSSTILDEKKIEETISDNNKKLEITMANDVVWNIDLSSVEDYSDVNINLQVELDEVDIPTDIAEAACEGHEYMLMELAHDGAFDFPVEISIPVSTTRDGDVASLYYYNEASGQMEYIGECIVSSDNMASFVLEHASKYMIVFSEESIKPVEKTAIGADSNTTVKQDSQEEKNGIISQIADNISFSKDDPNRVLVYGAIAVVIVLIGGIVLGVVIGSMRKHGKDDYFDEED